jgi:hypothetical protein
MSCFDRVNDLWHFYWRDLVASVALAGTTLLLIGGSQLSPTERTERDSRLEPGKPDGKPVATDDASELAGRTSAGAQLVATSTAAQPQALPAESQAIGTEIRKTSVPSPSESGERRVDGAMHTEIPQADPKPTRLPPDETLSADKALVEKTTLLTPAAEQQLFENLTDSDVEQELKPLEAQLRQGDLSLELILSDVDAEQLTKIVQWFVLGEEKIRYLVNSDGTGERLGVERKLPEGYLMGDLSLARKRWPRKLIDAEDRFCGRNIAKKASFLLSRRAELGIYQLVKKHKPGLGSRIMLRLQATEQGGIEIELTGIEPPSQKKNSNKF